MRPYVPFKDQVAKNLADASLRSMLDLGGTPAVLRLLGFPDVPLRMAPSILKKIHTGKGGQRLGLSEQQIAVIPEMLDTPVAVLKSATKAGALVVFANLKDGAGNYIIVSLEAGHKDANTPVNLLTSAYGKTRDEWLQEQIDAGRLLFLDQKKGFDTLDVSGITLNCDAEPGSQNLSLTTVKVPDDLVKYRKEQREKKLGKA